MPDTKHKLASANLKALQLAKARGIDGLLSTDSNASLEQRYQKRLVLEARIKQQNLELIMRQTIAYSDNNTGDDPDPDWLTAFMQMAENISSPKMQNLWAKILALEISNPGSFSVKSLKILKSMTQKEAQLFQRACVLASQVNDREVKTIIIGYNKPVAQLSLFKTPFHFRINTGLYRLPYSALMTLSELGLIHGNELESGKLNCIEPLMINYNGEHLKLQAKTSHLHLVYYRFTPTGNELSALIPDNPIDEYLKTIINNFNHDFNLD